MIKQRNLTAWIVPVTLVLAACGLGNTRLSPAEGAAFAAEVDDYIESYLAGSSECDFDKAYRGFDPVEWEGHLDESAFQQECEADLAEIGAYQSKTLDHVEDRQEIRCVIYHVVFRRTRMFSKMYASISNSRPSPGT